MPKVDPPADLEQPMFAEKTARGFDHVYPHELGVRMCGADYGGSRIGPSPIAPVMVRIDPNGLHWGWWDAKKNAFSMIYRSRVQTEICFPYGYEVEEERGYGRIVPLSVVPRSV